MVHFREFFKQGRLDMPTQKGIALTVPQFRQLVGDINDIAEDVDEVENYMHGSPEQSAFLSESAERNGLLEEMTANQSRISSIPATHEQ